MSIEIKQVHKLSQQLVMTPQLQQAIKLLQLSRMELVDLVREDAVGLVTDVSIRVAREILREDEARDAIAERAVDLLADRPARRRIPRGVDVRAGEGRGDGEAQTKAKRPHETIIC